MTLTEIVFEMQDAHDPVCRVTRETPGSHAVCRVGDQIRGTDTYRALITLSAPRPAAAKLVRDVNSSQAHEHTEVVCLTPETTTIRAGLRATDGRGEPSFLPVDLLLKAFGSGSVLEPILIRGGRARVRIIIPNAPDPQRALLTLRDLQRRTHWSDFRVIRAAQLDTTEYVESMRRILTPDQEDILRLGVQMGYYNIPKGATLEDIAKSLGLSVSPIHKRLKAIEGILVAEYVTPGSTPRPDFRRRPRRGTAIPPPAPMLDVALRVRAVMSAPNSFVRRTKGTRVLFQHLGTDPHTGDLSAALVVMATPDHVAKLASELEGHHATIGVETLASHADHAMLRVRTKAISNDTPDPTHPYAWFPNASRYDVLLKPALLEGEDLYLRFLITQPHTHDELTYRIDELARRGGWTEHEILAVRPFALDGVPPPRMHSDRLTPRQDEVLKIAFALGYYRTPRACTLETVAKTLGVSANAIHKNLAAAELGVITSYLSAGF